MNEDRSSALSGEASKALFVDRSAKMSAVRSTPESLMEEEGFFGEKAAAAAAVEEVGLLRRVWSEKKKLWVVAGPAIVVRVSTFGITVVSQGFIGRLGSTELAAYAIVATVILRFASGIIFGMASALETLSGQAFGAKQKHMLGIYLQRSWIILLLTTIFLVPLFIFTSPILRLLGQQMTITTTAATFSLWFIPVAFSFVFTYTFQIFFQSQSKNSIISYLACLSLALHILFSWLAVSKLSFGVGGAMSSSVIVLWFTIIGEFIFLSSDQCRDTWKGFSWDALRDLWPIIKLSFSSGLMICLDIWYYTVLILLTSHMKDAEIAIDALSICLNIIGCHMNIALGFLAAAGVRIANELGAGSAKNAKFSIRVAVATSLIIGSLFFALFLVFRGNLAYLFTKSSKVASTVSDLSPLLAFSLILNSLQPVLSGVAVGAGRQSIVACINVACYYLVGIPLGVIFGYVEGFNIKSMWLGMLIGTGVQTLALCFITWRTDWNLQVAKAQARVNKWVIPHPKESGGNNEAVV